MKTLVNAENTPEYRHIFDSVIGIAFMGTPFRGAESTGRREMEEKARMLYDDVYPGILRITQSNDEMLKGIVSEFMRKRGDSCNPARLVCFFELEPCYVTAVVDGKKTGRRTIRVNENSGCLDGAKRMPLQRNHFNMNKFGGPDEETYMTVLEQIVWIANRPNPDSQHEHIPQQRNRNFLAIARERH
ncbi:hypothetical protein F4802DRAFT_186339 [Xylaria palmicola]|nr:hypothetical protein F4802DRAFT_186339 [Xylaria palmicola]